MKNKAKAPVVAAKPLFQPGGFVREQARLGLDGTPGPKFADVYELDSKPLGEGRYSEVYAATNRITGARRAVKTARRRSASSTKIVEHGMECPGRLARHEADILKRMDHPNVIKLFEIYEEEDAVHLVLELCEGSDVLERILVSKGRLPEHEISLLFVQMLFATWHLHSRGVVHRDLKPEHFLFTRREPDRDPLPPRNASLKVIDFGLSHLAHANFVPLGGTPQFMPPEIINGMAPSQAVADRVDMWALGVVMHAMLVGHYPSPHLTDKMQTQYFAKSAWSTTSKECLDLLGSMLRQNPDSRPTVAKALQHPWVKNAISARGLPSDGLVSSLPAAIKSYAATPGLQKLVLLATAKDSDDFDYYGLRMIFQALLSNGGGGLTKEAMQAIAERDGPWSKIAGAIAQSSIRFGASGAGDDNALDWTEFMASALLMTASGAAKAAPISPDLPPLKEDVVWRSFDLLSLSSGEITGITLKRLLAFCPPGPKGGLGLPEEEAQKMNDEEDFERARGALAPPEALDRLIVELYPETGCVRKSECMALLRGEAKPPPKSSGGGVFACFKCGKAPAGDAGLPKGDRV
mmetsp:Transcript_73320/g.238640  ORF Transcript_73320/g.238640 Transcript_73320/m.238640 type:complete len:578 (+) Transcript_73320:144-1877(+)